MNNELQIPLFFPRQSQVSEKGIKILAGDVGGTKINIALYNATQDNVELIKEAKYHSAEHNSFTEVIQKFLNENKLETPERICAGVAGPVFHGKVRITNLPEELDAEEIKKAAGAKEVSLLNDLEVTAYGLASLKKQDIITLHQGNPDIKGNIAIIAPGTGLGEAGLYWDGKNYYPFPTEGGHSDFSPRTDLDIDLFHFLQKKYGIVSWERLIAGPGIHDIYLFLRDLRKKQEPEWLTKELANDDPSAVISKAGVENKDEICVEAMELFVCYLARESSNLVLKMKATGGLFLGGGIPPKIASLLQKEIFLKNYFDCDRMEDLLQNVPLKIITNDKTALLGAAYYGAYGAMIS
jgi:glucokinase